MATKPLKHKEFQACILVRHCTVKSRINLFNKTTYLWFHNGTNFLYIFFMLLSWNKGKLLLKIETVFRGLLTDLYHRSTLSFFLSNLFHGQIAQIYINHLSGPEIKKCSPWKVFGTNHPKTLQLLSRRILEARLSQH